jgi:hypothetical protein
MASRYLYDPAAIRQQLGVEPRHHFIAGFPAEQVPGKKSLQSDQCQSEATIPWLTAEPSIAIKAFIII